MKKIFVVALLAALLGGGLAVAQAPAHSKNAIAVKNSNAAAIGSSANAPQNAAQTTPGTVQQGAATTQAASPAHATGSNGGGKICRMVGSTPYYCL